MSNDPNAPHALRNIPLGSKFRLIGLCGRNSGSAAALGGGLNVLPWHPIITPPPGVGPANGPPWTASHPGGDPTAQCTATDASLGLDAPPFLINSSDPTSLAVVQTLWNNSVIGVSGEIEKYLSAATSTFAPPIKWIPIFSGQEWSNPSYPPSMATGCTPNNGDQYHHALANISSTPSNPESIYDLCGNFVAARLLTTRDDVAFSKRLFSTDATGLGGKGPYLQPFTNTIFAQPMTDDVMHWGEPDGHFVWTGTDGSGGAADALGCGRNNCPEACHGTGWFGTARWNAFSATVGNPTKGTLVPLQGTTLGENLEWINYGTKGIYDTSGYLYVISDVLSMPTVPEPIDPATIPLVHNRIGVCRPLCMIRLPGGVTGNVVQPAPIQMSTKVRNTKRLTSARGWRSVTLEQYNNIKSGKATFLGGCYKKK